MCVSGGSLLTFLFCRHVSDLVSGSNAKAPGSVAYVAFWPCIKEQLTWHEQERFSVLRKVRTDYGRGRAWLRAVLNEKSLERHLHAIIDPGALSPFYEEWAFLLEQEKSSVLPNVAAGISVRAAFDSLSSGICSIDFIVRRPWHHFIRNTNR